MQGYSPSVGMLLLNNAFNGLAISAILKFSNNIVRVIAHACSMVLTLTLETLFVANPPSPQLLVSVAVVACSTYLYNATSAPTLLTPKRVPRGFSTLDEVEARRPSGYLGEVGGVEVPGGEEPGGDAAFEPRSPPDHHSDHHSTEGVPPSLYEQEGSLTLSGDHQPRATASRRPGMRVA